MLVEISGIEPLTSWMPFRRSPSWAIPPDCRECIFDFRFWTAGVRNRFNWAPSWAIPPCLGDVLYNIIDRSKNQPPLYKKTQNFFRGVCQWRLIAFCEFWRAYFFEAFLLERPCPSFWWHQFRSFPPYRLPFEDQNMFCKQKTRAQPNAVLKDPRLTCTGLRSKE